MIFIASLVLLLIKKRYFTLEQKVKRHVILTFFVPIKNQCKLRYIIRSRNYRYRNIKGCFQLLACVLK